MPAESQDVIRVRLTLERFQHAYTLRDPDRLDQFLELFAPHDVEVIGTNAAFAGEGEWCLDLEAVRNLVRSDWEIWGDLELDIDGARIHVLGDVAWVSAWGTVSSLESPGETFADSVDRIRWVLDQEVSDEDRVLSIARETMDTLIEAQRGTLYIWPLRFTAVLTRRGERWVFRQIHFSFPTTRLPDVRLAPPEEESQ